jgi:hypothetical protein
MTTNRGETMTEHADPAVEALAEVIASADNWPQPLGRHFRESRAALDHIAAHLHDDTPEGAALRERLGLGEEWALQYERDGAPTMDDPSGVQTHTRFVPNRATAEQAVKNRVPSSVRNRRIVTRLVSTWRDG